MSQQKKFSNFEEWLQSLPEYVRKSPLMEYNAYPKALFLYDLVWFDCEVLMKDVRGKALVTQLIHSADSVSANIEEGYGRGFGADYARFLIIALGSARETQGRYVRARHILSERVVEHRVKLLDEIIAMLVTTSQQQRAKAKAKKQSVK